MPSSVTGSFAPVLKGVLQETDAGKVAWGTPAWAWKFPFPTLSFGSGAGADDWEWCYIPGALSIPAAGSLTLDLFGGTLEDEFGNALVFGSVKAMAFYNADAAIDVNVGGAASNAWEGWNANAGSKVLVPHGGCVILMAPNAFATAVDATHRNVQISNAGASAVTLYVGILG